MSPSVIERIQKKFRAVNPTLTERSRRLWVGAEAEALGPGGVAWVARATGMAISTVRKGRDECRRGTLELAGGRDRRAGGGRKRCEALDAGLIPALESLVHPTTRGDPESPLRWTTKSLQTLARELKRAKHPVSTFKVAELLRQLGFSLQANSKRREGSSHPDRNLQFEHINSTAESFLTRGLPVISVDAKKKEAIGQRGNRGREWQPKGEPVPVLSHDFIGPKDPVAIPYGIYDLGKNLGYVNVGSNHNTPTFAARSIERWWEQLGRQLYPNAKEIFITADAGGSNSHKSNVFKIQLQEVVDRIGVAIHVSHFPPGTSKWNKIEHRLFSFVSINWRARPLVSYEVVLSLIGATTTTTGLKVHAELDTTKYPLGIKATRAALTKLNLKLNTFHGDWNYVLRPRSAAERAAAAEPAVSKRTRESRRLEWLQVFQRQIQSGLSGKAFCVANGIHYSGFAMAKRRLLGKIRRKGRSTK